jgi:ketosteroid isomerase-like protein
MKPPGGLATIERFIARINAHDPSGIIALCTTDHVFIDSLGSRLSGPKRLQEAWAGYFSLFPDYYVKVEFTAFQDNLVLACGFASATHAASQKKWRIPAAWRAVVTGEKVTEWQVYADNKPVYELLSDQT